MGQGTGKMHQNEASGYRDFLSEWPDAASVYLFTASADWHFDKVSDRMCAMPFHPEAFTEQKINHQDFSKYNRLAMINNKFSLFFLFFSFPGTVFSATTPVTPKEIIFNFYKSYFSYLNNDKKIPVPEPAYSASFKKLRNYNLKLCRPYADEVCGWGSESDAFIDAQDRDDNLTIENTHFHITELPDNVIHVSFTVFPFEKNAQDGNTAISYKMIYEKNQWVVDDIIYSHDSSARQQMESENGFLIDELKKEGKAVPGE